MKNYRWILLAGLVVMMAGCASPAATVTPAPVDSASPASSKAVPGGVNASAEIVPAVTSQLGFLISARVKEVDVKEGDQVQAGQKLVVLDTPDLNTAVNSAQAALSSAQADANLQRYRRKFEFPSGRIMYLSGPPERIQKADALVDQTQATLEVAQANMAQGTLLAPYAGTVVELNAVPGQLVQPEQIVAILGDLSHLQVKTTDLSEREIAKVKLGQPVTVHVKALNQDVPGTVTAISPLATRKDNDLVFQVTIELDQQVADLRWGMTADVAIQTGE